ncbi:hypothetical protein HBI81_240840 [Parastagonospora nodorum]|nr:hypothetical protein HBI81_240840 [Parastagonospora nodorum]
MPAFQKKGGEDAVYAAIGHRFVSLLKDVSELLEEGGDKIDRQPKLGKAHQSEERERRPRNYSPNTRVDNDLAGHKRRADIGRATDSDQNDDESGGSSVTVFDSDEEPTRNQENTRTETYQFRRRNADENLSSGNKDVSRSEPDKPIKVLSSQNKSNLSSGTGRNHRDPEDTEESDEKGKTRVMRKFTASKEGSSNSAGSDSDYKGKKKDKITYRDEDTSSDYDGTRDAYSNSKRGRGRGRGISESDETDSDSSSPSVEKEEDATIAEATDSDVSMKCRTAASQGKSHWPKSKLSSRSK